MENTFEEKIKLCEIFLLNKSQLSMFGVVAYTLDKKIVQENEIPDSISHGYKIAAFCDGKCIYYVLGKVDTHELLGITIHEIIHIISHHLERCNGRDPLLWNICVDHITNRLIMELSKQYPQIELPEGSIFFRDIDRKYPNITPEKLYDLLHDKQKGQQSEPGINYEKVMSGDKPYLDVEYTDKNGNSEQFYVSMDVTNNNYSDDDDNEPQDVSEKIDALAEKSKLIYNSTVLTDEMSKGDLPGSIRLYLDQIFKTEIPWYEVLENAILYQTQNDMNPTWSQRNIYIKNVTLPSYIDGQGLDVLIASIDTSASVGDQDVSRFVGIILDSMKHFKVVYIIFHDRIIQDVFEFRDYFDENIVLEKIKNIRGRGGTSHLEVFDKIQDIYEYENISSVLFLTDYGSDVQRIYSNYRWIYEIPTIWILNRENPVNLTGCNTTTIHI